MQFNNLQITHFLVPEENVQYSQKFDVKNIMIPKKKVFFFLGGVCWHAS